MIRMPRIETLLGVTSLDQVDEIALRRLVDGEVREDTDLDFKEVLYKRNDDGKRELAKDVAAMANSRGGVLILGIRDADEVAAELTPVELAEGEELRMQQVLASLIAPAALYEIHPIKTGAGDRYYLIIVPPSADAPHAIRVGAESLRYPRRDGTHTRYLSESEVANAYRSRFAAAAVQIDRLDDVAVAAARALAYSPGWLTVTLVPNVGGDTGWGTAALRRVREWVSQQGDRMISNGFLHGVDGHRMTVKPRRFVSGYSDDEGRADTLHFELHADGAGFLGASLWNGAEEPPITVPADWLAVEILSAVHFLAAYAQDCAGAWGDAVVQVTMQGSIDALETYPPMGRAGIRRTLKVTARADTSHMVAIADAASRTSAASAVKPLLDDIWAAFGVPETPFIDQNGELQPNSFTQDWEPKLTEWLKRSS